MATRVTTYDRDGLTFDVRDGGPPDGTPVVLLHGFPQRATLWDGVVPHLHAAGLRTLAPDQRGYSPGARPVGRSAYRASELVADVAALVEAVGGGPVHLVGHDWGAAVAWGTAARHPDLVATLTTVSVPHPAAMGRSLVSSDQALRSWYVGAFQLPLLPEVLLRQRAVLERVVRAAGMPEPAVDRVWPEMVEDGALRGALGWYRAVPFADRDLARSPVRVPTTHVWSDGDVSLGRRGAELTADHVRADYRLEVLEGVSHWVPDEVPERLAEIVLERVGSV